MEGRGATLFCRLGVEKKLEIEKFVPKEKKCEENNLRKGPIQQPIVNIRGKEITIPGLNQHEDVHWCLSTGHHQIMTSMRHTVLYRRIMHNLGYHDFLSPHSGESVIG